MSPRGSITDVPSPGKKAQRSWDGRRGEVREMGVQAKCDEVMSTWPRFRSRVES